MKQKILVIDDERAIGTILSSALARDGNFIITQASSADEAIDKLNEEQYDLILSDYNMPRMNGLELGEKIAEFAPDSVFMLMSAYDTDALRQKVRAASFVSGYLRKPFRLADVRRTITNVLQTRTAADEDDSSAKTERPDCPTILNGLQEQLKVSFVSFVHRSGEVICMTGTENENLQRQLLNFYQSLLLLDAQLANQPSWESSVVNADEYKIFIHAVGDNHALLLMTSAEETLSSIRFHAGNAAEALNGLV